MNFPLFLLVFLLIFSSFAAVTRCWPQHGRVQSRAEASVRTSIHRLLKPRTPDDCPACQRAPTSSLGTEPVPAPVRPWREVKSRRGAPKRIPTEGYACPNQQCVYFGITAAEVHALVGDGKHGQTEQIQTFRGPACHTTFTSRRHTPCTV